LAEGIKQGQDSLFGVDASVSDAGSVKRGAAQERTGLAIFQEGRKKSAYAAALPLAAPDGI